MGGLALIRTGDRVRIDLGRGTADVLIPAEDLEQRRRELTRPAATPTRVADALAGDPALDGGSTETGPSSKGRNASSGSPRPPAFRATTTSRRRRRAGDLRATCSASGNEFRKVIAAVGDAVLRLAATW